MSKALYFGDNLDILREFVPDESIDLIYLDPPFNSQATYNLLFQTPKAEATAALAEAFRDTWSWGAESALAYKEIMQAGGVTARYIEALGSALKESDMMAYLTMMTVRLIELRRKLKKTGSIYLHCDPTASHYLKIVLDSIFGPECFRNEIIWKRTSAHSASKKWADIHDCILFYTKSADFTWNKITLDYDDEYKARFKNSDPIIGEWTDDNLTAPGIRKGFSGAVWRGFNPTEKGNHWKVSRSTVAQLVGEEKAKSMTTIEKLDLLDEKGYIYWPQTQAGFPRFKRVLGSGTFVQDIISDVAPLNSQARERIGYPTQKPVALLERIISVSSNKGDTILDPFCGCGTTIDAAQKLERSWIGIDIAVHSIKVIEARLSRSYQGISYALEGIPRDFESALRLAERDKWQFQWWANYLFNPHALKDQKRGADRGVDGELFFPNGPGRVWGKMLIFVKGGLRIGPAEIREFRGVLTREKAELGLFVCLYPPTAAMRQEAASLGLADVVHGDIPRMQIVSIQEFFQGVVPRLPPLEHLPSALLSSAKRRVSQKSLFDRDQPQLPLPFLGGKSAGKTHYNPITVLPMKKDISNVKLRA